MFKKNSEKNQQKLKIVSGTKVPAKIFWENWKKYSGEKVQKKLIKKTQDFFKFRNPSNLMIQRFSCYHCSNVTGIILINIIVIPIFCSNHHTNEILEAVVL